MPLIERLMSRFSWQRASAARQLKVPLKSADELGLGTVIWRRHLSFLSELTGFPTINNETRRKN